MGYFTAQSIFVDPTASPQNTLPPLTSPVSTRGPASEDLDANKHLNIQFDYNCGTKNEVVNSPYRFIQIKSRICLKGKKISSSNLSKNEVAVPSASVPKIQIRSIINQSNHVTASIFEVGPSRFETDIIALTQGDNLIQVDFLIEGEVKSQKFHVISK